MRTNVFLPQIKVWEVDYSFIISNYLQPKMWTKRWTLFTYGEHTFYLEMKAIHTLNRRIEFRVACGENSSSFSYALDNMTADFLKKQINLAIYGIIGSMERKQIMGTEEFETLGEANRLEENTLNHMAYDCMAKKGLNQNIRDTYAGEIVYELAELGMLHGRYIAANHYHVMTNLWMAFAEAIGDMDRIEDIKDSMGHLEIDGIMQEAAQRIRHLTSEEGQTNLRETIEEMIS